MHGNKILAFVLAPLADLSCQIWLELKLPLADFEKYISICVFVDGVLCCKL